MARTKQEVRDFLNSQVGQRVNAKAGIYNGQCVSLIKALLEFLGVPNPYAARGDAIYVNDTLLRQGIAKPGQGWLTIVVNRDMGYIDGVHYGHIWIDLAGEANFEQNGARALYTTKNTRPYSQGQQFVNLDSYIQENDMSKTDLGIARILTYGILGRNGADGSPNALGGFTDGDINANHIGFETNEKIWQLYNSGEGKNWIEKRLPNLITKAAQVDATNAKLVEANKALEAARKTAVESVALKEAAEKKAAELAAENTRLIEQENSDKAAGDTLLRRIGQFFSKYWVEK